MDDKRKLLKVAEEASEIIQVVMKIKIRKSRDRCDLIEKLHSEVGDMLAHVEALVDSGYLDMNKLIEYKNKKKEDYYGYLNALEHIT